MARTKGAKDLRKTQKAQILAKKKLQEFPTREIAAQIGVSHTTVSKITPESVSPDVLEMSERFERQFEIYAEANAMKAQRRAFDSISELNAKDATIVAEKNFNMRQVIKNASTTKTLTDVDVARAIFRELLELGHKRERIIKKLEAEFPAIDVEVLEKENV